MDFTTVRVSEPVAEELHGRKRRGESYDDALRRVLGMDGTDADREQLRAALSGSGDVLEARVDAILAMYAHLREHGHAEKSDLLSVVDVDATGYASPDSLWANMVKGKDTLAALPGVETPATGRTTWRYSDPDGSD